jgi:hypothetical protein
MSKMFDKKRNHGLLYGLSGSGDQQFVEKPSCFPCPIHSAEPIGGRNTPVPLKKKPLCG